MITPPFGQHDCESEIKDLGDKYRDLFFSQTRFNKAALDSATYLIIGRRGAGKTALSHYFQFQPDWPRAKYIEVDEPRVYERFLLKIANHSKDSNSSNLARPIDIWEYLLWNLIIKEWHKWVDCSDVISEIKSVNISPASLLDRSFDWLKKQIGITTGDETDGLSDNKLSDILREKDFSSERQKVLEFASDVPIFLAIDTLEKYNINDDGLMNAMAGLIEAAAKMHLDYADKGIHIKVFISGELFPHLMEVVLKNPLKSVHEEVYMIWRYKDLLRLIAWRFNHYLKKNNYLSDVNSAEINWSDPKDVLARAWNPYFGNKIKNSNNILENTFPYILRHTQMRPRQLIVICNAIAKKSQEDGSFPNFSRDHIVEGVADGERKLAAEILNSYSLVYPRVAKIVNVLSQMPVTFKGNLLDKLSAKSKPLWDTGDYSSAAFSRLVTELGIVGRVLDDSTNYINAEFAYAQSHRVEIIDRDKCVIHPMFFKHLNIAQSHKPVIVMPFSVSNEDQQWL